MTNTIETGSNPHDNPPRFRARVSHAWLTRETGQSLIELALTLPLFLFILEGAAEFARFAWASIEASSAARAGVQYGAQNHTFASDTSGMQTVAMNDATNLSGLTATASHSCVCSTAPSTSVSCSVPLTTSCPSPAILLESVQVNTSAAVTPVLHWPGLPATFTARGFAIMAVEQ
jgi:Flp pilus assembly protein TadG